MITKEDGAERKGKQCFSKTPIMNAAAGECPLGAWKVVTISQSFTSQKF